MPGAVFTCTPQNRCLVDDELLGLRHGFSQGSESTLTPRKRKPGETNYDGRLAGANLPSFFASLGIGSRTERSNAVGTVFGAVFRS
jgi:hypothetical protein